MSLNLLLEQALREGRFSLAANDGADRDSHATLLSRLAALQVTGLHEEEALESAILQQGALALTQYDANLLYFCDQVFTQFQQQTDIDQTLLAGFMSLRPLFAGLFLRDPSVLRNMDHPLLSLAALLLDTSRFWSPDLGRPGEKYRARIEEMLSRLAGADLTQSPFSSWLEEFTAQMEKENQRAETLSQRICDSEKASLASKKAERVVRQQLSLLLSSTPMPVVVEELLKGPFRQSMQLVFFNQGVDSDAWRHLLRAGRLLLESFKPPADDAARQVQYQLISKLPALLGKALVSISNQADLDEWIGQIEKLHMKILTGSTVELRDAEPLSALDEENGVDTNISEALLKSVSRIAEGQWLIYQREGECTQHLRLALKMEDAGQLLFVNVLGAKCMEKSVEEFAYLLAARHVRLMNTETNLSQMLRDTVAYVLQLFQRQSLLMAEAAERQRQEEGRRQQARDKAHREAEQIAAERLAAQVRADEDAQQLAYLAAKKAAAEADVAAEREKQEAQLAEQRQRLAEKQSNIDEWETAMQAVRALCVGGWVDIEIKGERQRCKLAAVINASDKLIFAGRDGRKMAEFRRDDLIMLIMDHKARIIETGDHFESSLARVIQTLRKD